jgi:ribosomal protein S18 acetylase RimI-like enzyme
MTVHVEAVDGVSDELVDAVRRLVPQLSSSVAAPGPDWLERVVAFPGNRLLVARSAGAIVGVLTLVLFPIPTGMRARIEDVVVDEAARGQGIGTALTLEALRLAEAGGARTVDLTSRPGREAANRLYLRLGFRQRDSRVYRYAGPPAGDA